MYRLDHKSTSGLAAWVAIVAIALNVFWPLIAQLQPGKASTQMEACTEAHMQHGDMGEHDSAPALSLCRWFQGDVAPRKDSRPL